MIDSKGFGNIRVIAIMLIILLHAALPNVGFQKLVDGKEVLSGFDLIQVCYHSLYLNLFTGNILFFTISGFLFQMQLASFTNFTNFLIRKFKSLLIPFLVFGLGVSAFLIIFVYPNFGQVKDVVTITYFFESLWVLIFDSILWFIPSLFIILVLNYFFKTRLLLLTVLSFVLWLLLYINCYLNVVKLDLFGNGVGYVFIFVIGRLFFLYNEKLASIQFLYSKKKLFFSMIVFYMLLNLESLVLYQIKGDFLNSLRIANVLYSYTVFFLLNRIFIENKWVLLKGYTVYFIYLMHIYCLGVTGLFFQRFGFFTYPTQLIFNLLNFIFVFGMCLIIHKIFFSIKINSRFIASYIFKEKPTLVLNIESKEGFSKKLSDKHLVNNFITVVPITFGIKKTKK